MSPRVLPPPSSLCDFRFRLFLLPSPLPLRFNFSPSLALLSLVRLFTSFSTLSERELADASCSRRCHLAMDHFARFSSLPCHSSGFLALVSYPPLLLLFLHIEELQGSVLGIASSRALVPLYNVSPSSVPRMTRFGGRSSSPTRMTNPTRVVSACARWPGGSH